MASAAAAIERSEQTPVHVDERDRYATHFASGKLSTEDTFAHATGDTTLSFEESRFGGIGHVDPIHLEGDASSPTVLVGRLIGEAETIFRNNGAVRAETITDDTLVKEALETRGWDVVQTGISDSGVPIFEASFSFSKDHLRQDAIERALIDREQSQRERGQEQNTRIPHVLNKGIGGTENGTKAAHTRSQFESLGLDVVIIPAVETHNGSQPDSREDARSKLGSTERILARRAFFDGDLDSWLQYQRGCAPIIVTDLIKEIPQVVDGEIEFVPLRKRTNGVKTALENLYLFGQEYGLTQVPIATVGATGIRHRHAQDSYSIRTNVVYVSVSGLRQLLNENDTQMFEEYERLVTDSGYSLDNISGGIDVVALEKVGLVTGIRESGKDTIVRPHEAEFDGVLDRTRLFVEGQPDTDLVNRHRARYRLQNPSARISATQRLDEERERYGVIRLRRGGGKRARKKLQRAEERYNRAREAVIAHEYATNFKVLVCGGSKYEPDSPEVNLITNMMETLVRELGVDGIGGAGPGIMYAAARGLVNGREEEPKNGNQAGARNHAVGLVFPWKEQRPLNLFDYYRDHVEFLPRLQDMIDLSHIVYVGPGALGTEAELWPILQLQQVKHLEGSYTIIVHPSMKDRIEALRQQWLTSYRKPLINKNDLRVIYSDNLEEIVDAVTKTYNTWYANYGSRVRSSRFPRLERHMQDLGRVIRRQAASAA